MNSTIAEQTRLQPASLAQRFAQVRAHTLALTQGLTAEDMQVQSMPDASPIKWHLAHTTWFFETFLLQRFARGYQALNPAYRTLFNSYYVGVGERHPRPQRGLVTRPGIDEVLAYRAHVDAAMLQLLEKLPADAVALAELGLQHEQQHQELMLTDVKHLFSCNPLLPAVRSSAPRAADGAAALRFTQFKGGLTQIGHAGNGFCFDNETPRHQVFLQPYALANRLVTNGEFVAFVEDSGYTQAHCWLSEGVDWINRESAMRPFYWRKVDGRWHEFTLHGLQPLDLHQPVLHLSYFEADAYARWADARLPTEFEWEHAAQQAGAEMTQLFGQCWQWTSSSYAPYPGYAPLPGAVGEYNGTFMANQYVLRGSSSATPPGHARVTYRNFFPTAARWQFTGLRLARSL
ncbi:MAG: ergothioneine biosynthesis protein EgtB [Burkholderiaceae bacterium]